MTDKKRDHLHIIDFEPQLDIKEIDLHSEDAVAAAERLLEKTKSREIQAFALGGITLEGAGSVMVAGNAGPLELLGVVSMLDTYIGKTLTERMGDFLGEDEPA